LAPDATVKADVVCPTCQLMAWMRASGVPPASANSSVASWICVAKVSAKRITPVCTTLGGMVGGSWLPAASTAPGIAIVFWSSPQDPASAAAASASAGVQRRGKERAGT
jgi:hypothetical protein